ncbi:hypothetical protein D0U02_24455 [Burkholderia pseudomallei]|uniref:Uncharacterized protein n=2 Tax=Burkholderia pseudomallei TaxID=28450 RepID=A0AAX0UG89_BURPE|nr:hypothetical protein BURPS668_2272 [Burkholderia pseudomallei 668]ABN91390.1 hypothetical protein BURPS1106A_2312 [Burkholderia pseudomallei 1106a]AFR16224.1 hypothetical protein BPC006_I2354 [Burkholderia pseudomallei BPC006]ARL48989.1 hypothetical protein BOC51_02275 [Burkholderia pseudomallei]EBA50907.1 hypothetical protein BURPS305_6921 [Burkholderia pseudomallei 305]EDO84860.1 hypothetical protein BURPS406E_H0671 [Burkholderia pseudomallei 406e]EDO92487.1 hypothetical protein BURPSPAS
MTGAPRANGGRRENGDALDAHRRFFWAKPPRRGAAARLPAATARDPRARRQCAARRCAPRRPRRSLKSPNRSP